MSEYYNSIAKGYDELHEQEQIKKLKLIRDKIHSDKKLLEFNPDNKKILDVGCGSGISTRFFNAKERFGIDPSKGLLSIAIQKDPQGKYLLMRAEDMKFRSVTSKEPDKFDIIQSLTAIQNFDDIDKGLTKIKEIGKRFILSFLKKSEKKSLIEKCILEKFLIIKKIEEDKDMIYFCE